MTKALVTGGGGFLGQYVTEQLVARGEQVRVLCRGDYPALKPLGVEIQRGDIRNLSDVETACQGIDTIYHTAAIAGIWGRWQDYYEINTLGTQHLLAAAVKSGVRKFIHTSSPSVVFDGREHLNADESLPYPRKFLCHYPRSKMLAERMVLAVHGKDGLLTTALRPHLIWGPRDKHLIPRLVARAKSGRLRQVGNGRNWISMSYVENAAAAHLQAADALTSENSAAGGRAYFINELEPVLIWNWINELLTIAGVPPVRKSISASLAYTAGGLLEGVYALLGKQEEPLMTRFLAQQLSLSHTYSVAGAQADFGYHPIVDPQTALNRLIPDLKRLGRE